ncbi:AmmeMemoRadiSam system protein B [Patescibacteria group bacterium]|nr:AmmeMemoRadiSam system protein B [Patescibacteria group bacterium]
MMRLDEQISVARTEIVSDGYDMSVGEIINLYKDEEIVISPDFQRLFRWDSTRKTRFIESLLLGIPIPPIFVYQDEKGVWELIDGLQRSLRREGQPVTLTSDEHLNYASAIPLALLTENLPKVELVPITYSNLDAKSHFQFGQALKDRIMNSRHRIAVIASGDMSHALNTSAPAGFHKDGPRFDEKIQELIAQKNTAGLLSLKEDLIQNAAETSYKPLTMLFGLLERVSVTPSILSYEAPFGVGYLVVNFALR